MILKRHRKPSPITHTDRRRLATPRYGHNPSSPGRGSVGTQKAQIGSNPNLDIRVDKCHGPGKIEDAPSQLIRFGRLAHDVLHLMWLCCSGQQRRASQLFEGCVALLLKLLASLVVTNSDHGQNIAGETDEPPHCWNYRCDRDYIRH